MAIILVVPTTWIFGIIAESRRIEQIHQLGGFVYYEQAQNTWLTDPLMMHSTGDIYAIHFDDCSDINHRHLTLIHHFREVESLSFMRSGITDEDLESLSTLPNVRSLNLVGTEISDSGIGHFSRHSALELAGLNGTNCTDACLVELSKCRDLKALGLESTSVTDNGIRTLRDMKNLSELNIQGTRVTDAGVEILVELRLRSLNLGGEEITDESLNHIEQMHNLEELWVVSHRISEDGINEFCPGDKLETINLLLPNVPSKAMDRLQQRVEASVVNHNHLIRGQEPRSE